LQGIDKSQFILLGKGENPPAGVLVIGEPPADEKVQMIVERGTFSAYMTSAPQALSRLNESGIRQEKISNAR